MHPPTGPARQAAQRPDASESASVATDRPSPGGDTARPQPGPRRWRSLGVPLVVAAVGLLVAQPPQESGWIAGMTGRAPAAYLQTMFVDAQERGTGIGSALVRTLHAELDARDVAVTLLHHSQVNPVSGPFWNRMGYRPLGTSWEARPAAALR